MLAFALAVFLLIVTPGPGVLTAAGVGAAYGWRPGIFYLAGLFAGTNLVCLAVISGLAAAILAEPVIRTVLLLGSSAYLGYLALRIAFAGTRIAFMHVTAPGFRAGLALQFINPKAYAVNTTLFSSFAFHPGNFAVETGLKLVIVNAIWIPIHLVWLHAGVAVNRLDLPAGTQRIINAVMAACLIGVVALSVWSLQP